MPKLRPAAPAPGSALPSPPAASQADAAAPVDGPGLRRAIPERDDVAEPAAPSRSTRPARKDHT